MSKETYICQKRHIFVKRDVHFPKETCTRATCDSTQRAHGYSSLSLCTSKETYNRCVRQKKHTFAKRDLRTSHTWLIVRRFLVQVSFDICIIRCVAVICCSMLPCITASSTALHCCHMYVCNTQLFVVLHVCLCWSLWTHVCMCACLHVCMFACVHVWPCVGLCWDMLFSVDI